MTTIASLARFTTLLSWQDITCFSALRVVVVVVVTLPHPTGANNTTTWQPNRHLLCGDNDLIYTTTTGRPNGTWVNLFPALALPNFAEESSCPVGRRRKCFLERSSSGELWVSCRQDYLSLLKLHAIVDPPGLCSACYENGSEDGSVVGVVGYLARAQSSHSSMPLIREFEKTINSHRSISEDISSHGGLVVMMFRVELIKHELDEKKKNLSLGIIIMPRSFPMIAEHCLGRRHVVVQANEHPSETHFQDFLSNSFPVPKALVKTNASQQLTKIPLHQRDFRANPFPNPIGFRYLKHTWTEMRRRERKKCQSRRASCLGSCEKPMPKRTCEHEKCDDRFSSHPYGPPSRLSYVLSGILRVLDDLWQGDEIEDGISDLRRQLPQWTLLLQMALVQGVMKIILRLDSVVPVGRQHRVQFVCRTVCHALWLPGGNALAMAIECLCSFSSILSRVDDIYSQPGQRCKELNGVMAAIVQQKKRRAEDRRTNVRPRPRAPMVESVLFTLAPLLEGGKLILQNELSWTLSHVRTPWVLTGTPFQISIAISILNSNPSAELRRV
ncbi:uncharacterized protein MYCFIDRAFT_206960 [Pseudocercospora fijiensis CIRAD86]|uniref:Uncharacterized protein n=1 Tax=Pseudocercospora fijiensis (strain CIRAD86) TaxID=383855 RepID=M2ZAJ5_PSEFD|nr:uncharacterized protein MYCFIDRAFT_206960 [Pseudocercospora fijiensis CIRAD86]EME86830.1 hypothetical protein MYCFIDRAFT_206960 [Pseudocercospora fijiensis CIRAD86]